MEANWASDTYLAHLNSPPFALTLSYTAIHIPMRRHTVGLEGLQRREVGLLQQCVPIRQGHLKWIGMKGGGAIPLGRKEGATHEKVIKQDAHQWMPQAEKARREMNKPRGRGGMFVHKISGRCLITNCTQRDCLTSDIFGDMFVFEIRNAETVSLYSVGYSESTTVYAIDSLAESFLSKD